jgi:ADP-ribosylglycohydrolase
LLLDEQEHDEVRALLDTARRAAGAAPRAAIESVGEGWVAEEALAIGVLCALDSREDGVTQALWRAAAHAGDSDSTASIAGQLIGAARGASALPSSWIAELELADLIERVACDLHAAAIQGRVLDAADYAPHDGLFRLAR